MKQSEHLNPSEETGTGCTFTSNYGRTPPNKHGGVGGQQHDYKRKKVKKAARFLNHIDWYHEFEHKDTT